MVLTDDAHTLERQVKQHLLKNQKLFNHLGDLGTSRIVFEKVYGKLRADALIFTEDQGIIGVEIKTEYDNLKRLPRQLSNYKQICNYVYVYCHDSHLKAVIQLLKDKGFWGYVGIVSYTVFKGKIIAGVYKQAKQSPYYHVAYALKMLWKDEVRGMINAYTGNQAEILANMVHVPFHKVYNNKLNYNRFGYHGAGSVGLSKAQLIRNYVGLFGEQAGTQVLCQRFIYDDMNPEKHMKLYHFNDNINHPVEVGFDTKYRKYKWQVSKEQLWLLRSWLLHGVAPSNC